MKLNNMKLIKPLVATALSALAISSSVADDRRFTYTYEPEVLPKGAIEFEQWVTLRSQRTSGGTVKRENFNRFEIREEFEFGVTDRYTVGLYLNGRNDSYRDVSAAPPVDRSTFSFKGISIENRYMLLNPADRPIGLTLYLEPTFAGDELEIEQKIIIGQRHGDWKWAFNVVHATEWEHNFNDHKGEFELTFGVTRDLSSNWSLGLELRNDNEIPEYKRWDNTALFLGPVASYRQDKWFATVSVMPQIFGRNFTGEPDAMRNLDLSRHERYNVRLIVGIDL